MTRLLKLEFSEDLFGDVFLDYSGKYVIFDIAKFDQDKKIKFTGELRLLSVETGEKVKSISIPEGDKDIKLKEGELFLEYYDEKGNVYDYRSVKI